MGHALGLTVVAEAVELEDEHDHLLALGFDVGQGYLSGRPGVDPTAQPVALEQVFSAAAH
jgi:EAL domain-containing protein (putative c-di-GMP-specific phosphodiesterase class I)